jgi:hypothetical protein
MPLADDLVLSKANCDDIINSDEISSAAAYTLATTQATLERILHAEDQAAAGTNHEEERSTMEEEISMKVLDLGALHAAS